MGMSVALYRKLERIGPDLRDALLTLFEEVERNREESVTKREFNELKEIVRDLAEAQLKTEARLEGLTLRVDQLAAAQRRTEERLEELAAAQKKTEERLDSLALKVEELAEAQKRTEARVEELAAAQKRTEERLEELAAAQKRTEQRLEELAAAQKKTEERLDSLALKVEELAEAQRRTEARVEELAAAQKRTEERLEELAAAQKRTEERLEELAAAQKRTEERLEELAEAQKQTEKEVASLARGLKATREQVGGLARSMAYALENEAYRKLPAHLATFHGIVVQDRIVRADVADEEINFFARARKNGKPVILIGESVLRLDDASKLKSLQAKLEKVSALMPEELIPLVVTHYAKPKVLEKAREAGMLVIQSFEWD
ncbi:MAG: hypothetical protein WHS46_07815 [Desulfosoma sp.]